MTVVGRKILAEGIECRQFHPTEEMSKHLLLGLVVRIEPQLHQHQQRRIAQKAPQEPRPAFRIEDKGQQGITGGQRTVEVKGQNLSHNAGLGIRSISCFTAHERAMATSV